MPIPYRLANAGPSGPTKRGNAMPQDQTPQTSAYPYGLNQTQWAPIPEQRTNAPAYPNHPAAQPYAWTMPAPPQPRTANVGRIVGICIAGVAALFVVAGLVVHIGSTSAADAEKAKIAANPDAWFIEHMRATSSSDDTSDNGTVIALGHTICSAFSQGKTLSDLEAAGSTGTLSYAQIDEMARLSVKVYCPEYQSSVN
jgi:hypothetical protein